MADTQPQSVALITGAASGIGAALAQALQARGARIAAVDLGPADPGPGGLAITADLADPAAPAAIIAQAYAHFGRIDLVCSNAGIGRNKRLLKEPLDAAYDRLFAINFASGLRLAQAYEAALRARGQTGHILFTASENALSVPAAVRGAGLGLYAASKHALLAMAEWLRDELAAGGAPLTPHVLLPGAVWTRMIQAAIPDPDQAPPALHLIRAERCAEIALRGLDLGLFYIPTQAHLAEDMTPRTQMIREALRLLEL